MTDNRATELLCKLLEERSEDYTRNDFGITWSYYSDPHTATESMDGTLIVTGLTPEQAIAATLGNELNPDGLPVIVRCRDCVAYEPYHTYAGMKLDYGECTQHRRQTDDDRFCWWAERSDR